MAETKDKLAAKNVFDKLIVLLHCREIDGIIMRAGLKQDRGQCRKGDKEVNRGVFVIIQCGSLFLRNDIKSPFFIPVVEELSRVSEIRKGLINRLVPLILQAIGQGGADRKSV